MKTFGDFRNDLYLRITTHIQYEYMGGGRKSSLTTYHHIFWFKISRTEVHNI